jgi:gliding motility-associated-like protein
VSLTVTNASGSNTKTVTAYITVYSAPTVNFTVNDTAGCPPHAVTFTDQSNPVVPGPATYHWSFGDGNTSTLLNPGHNYPASGYYNVTLSVTNSGGCVSSLTKPNYIHVYTPPDANFSAAQTSFCNIPATATFTPAVVGSGPYTYSWAFGDGGTGTGGNPSHTYSTAGSYTVTMIVTDVNGCKDTVVKPAYINVGLLDANFTVTPAAGCVNTPITFNNVSVGAGSATWDFDDGNTSTSMSATHVFTAAGTYDVKLVVFNGACSDSVTIPVTIHPQPDADFEGVPIDPCPAPALIQYNNLSTGANSYAWAFGDGGTSSQANPSHTYNANGWYTVTLVATSSFGCKDTIVKPQYMKVYDLVLDAGAIPAQGCVPLDVQFGTATYTNTPFPVGPYPYGTASTSWDFGDGNTSTDPSPMHTYTTIGTYTVHCTVVTDNGCTQVDSFVIHVGPKPNTFFTAAPPIVCNHDTVFFSNQTTGATNYVWDFGDGGSSGATNPYHIYTTSGTYTITLHAYNNGCDSAYTVDSMILIHPPTAIFHAVYNCDTPLLVKFYDTATIEATSRVWHFGDGGTSTSIMPVHTYSALGNYNVTLITYNSIYGCTDTMTLPITLIDPVLTFSTPDTAICRHDSITFNPVYTGISLGYAWYINNSFVDTFTNQGYRFHQNGLYKVKVIATDIHGCLDSAVRNNYVLVAKPTADFIAQPTVGCLPLTVAFTETSTNTPGAYSVTRVWDFGNGNTSTVNTAGTSQTYTAPGFYDVQMIVTDNVGCSDTLMKNDYIEVRQPVANFVANDTNACIGQGIVFANTSTGVSLSSQWDFGDGGSSNIGSPTYAYSNTGTYTVRLIVTDPSGCKDTILKVNHVIITKPDASFLMSDTLAICPPLNVIFTNTSTGASSYVWTFGNSTGSTLQNPTGVYPDPGIYSIQMISINGQGCADTAFGSANVLGYAGGLSYTPLTGCAPLQVDFTANLTNVPSIVWDFSDGVTIPATGPTTSHTYLTPGAYVPKLILSDGSTCLNSSLGLDTIKVDGVYAGFTTSPLCENTMAFFQDTSFSFFSSVTSWSWSFNNGQQTSNISNPSNFYPSPGTYPVSLIVTNDSGCTDTVLRNITINTLPVISAGLDTVVCTGDAAQLSGSGGVSYVWAPGTSLTCTACQTTFASPTVPTNYSVTGTDQNGCVNTDTVRVNLQYITTSAVENGGEICTDSVFQLMVSGAHHYEWQPAASLDDNTLANPLASPTVTTVYTVHAWEGSCPPDSHKVTVVVHPLPVVNAGGDETIIAGNSAMLQATGTNTNNFLWTPSETLSCDNCSNPIASPLVTTQYTVRGTSYYGCKNTDSVTVFIVCDESQLFIPNLFSPNGDGQNDVFFVRGEGLRELKSFRVFNRWGEQVFERKNISANDEANGWDGTFKGAQLNPDVYVYLIEGVCDTGDPVLWKGDVTLVR